MSAGAPASISSRTACPRRRACTSSSIALSRSSTSSSSLVLAVAGHAEARPPGRAPCRGTARPGAAGSRLRVAGTRGGVGSGSGVRASRSGAVVSRRVPAPSAGSGTNRGSTPGTCTTANSVSASLGRRQHDGQVERLVRAGAGTGAPGRWPAASARGRSRGGTGRGGACGRRRSGPRRRAGRCRVAASAGSTSSRRHAVLLGDQLADASRLICSSCSPRRHAGRPRSRSGCRPAPSAAAADADHEELVEVRAEDGEELEPLQQRHGRVLGLFEHAAVELEPAQFAVDVQRRVVEVGRVGRQLHGALRNDESANEVFSIACVRGS